MEAFVNLQSGQGSCPLQARYLFRPQPEVLELGAWGDVRTRVLRTVHHMNRNGEPGDFIAVAFPEMKKRGKHLTSGMLIEVFGSEKALHKLVSDENVELLKRRGMIKDGELWSFNVPIGENGRAYVRDRSAEKGARATIERLRRRAETRGVTLNKDIVAGRKGKHGEVLMLRLGKSVINVRSVEGVVSSNSVSVNTYGFSASTAPSFLPVGI